MDYETEEIQVTTVDGITVVRLRNANLISTSQLTHIAAEVEGLLDRGADKLVMDFKHVEFAGSAALGFMIRLQKRITAAGLKLVLSHTEHISEMLRISRTAALFKIAPDLRTARKMF